MEKTFHFIVVSYYAVLSFNDEYEYGSCLLGMLLTLDRIAQTSPFFQRNEGRDHIILSTDYVSHRKTINWCPKCIHFHQGNSDEIQRSLQLTEFAKKQKQQQQRDPSESSTSNYQFYDYIKDYYFNDYGGGIGKNES
jgi:putative component of membrane protein insertase Oxa1/YidC/SpoIIIJ protein YidD